MIMILLKKRALVESVNDELKNICQIEHTRHRCMGNFLTNLLSGLIAYSFLPKKPSLNIDIIDNKLVRTFVLIELTLIRKKLGDHTL